MAVGNIRDPINRGLIGKECRTRALGIIARGDARREREREREATMHLRPGRPRTPSFSDQYVAVAVRLSSHPRPFITSFPNVKTRGLLLRYSIDLHGTCFDSLDA
jgi:hypothetical protein